MRTLFNNPKVVIGMVHLQAMPGFPGYSGSMQKIIDHALTDALNLEKGGVDGLIVENIFNRPRQKVVGPETVSPMTLILNEIVKAVNIPVGVKVLFNSYEAQIAMVNCVGAHFARISVWVDAAVTVAGIIEGCASDAIRYRKMIGAENVKILADIHIKHAAPLAYRPIEHAAYDALGSGMADGVVTSGQRTGQPTDVKDVAKVRKMLNDKFIMVGSGTTPDNVTELLEYADGVIVGTYFKEGGIIENPVHKIRVQKLVDIVREIEI